MGLHFNIFGLVQSRPLPTKILKLSDFKVLGSSGHRISDHKSSRRLCQDLGLGGTDGSLAVDIGYYRHWTRVGNRELAG